MTFKLPNVFLNWFIKKHIANSHKFIFDLKFSDNSLGSKEISKY